MTPRVVERCQPVTAPGAPSRRRRSLAHLRSQTTEGYAPSSSSFVLSVIGVSAKPRDSVAVRWERLASIGKNSRSRRASSGGSSSAGACPESSPSPCAGNHREELLRPMSASTAGRACAGHFALLPFALWLSSRPRIHTKASILSWPEAPARFRYAERKVAVSTRSRIGEAFDRKERGSGKGPSLARRRRFRRAALSEIRQNPTLLVSPRAERSAGRGATSPRSIAGSSGSSSIAYNSPPVRDWPTAHTRPQILVGAAERSDSCLSATASNPSAIRWLRTLVR